jgi:hypothetical protein
MEKKMKKNSSKILKLFNRVLYLGSVAMLVSALVLTVSVQPAAAVANPGAIWTTDGSCGTSSQDVNHFAVGATVYINYRDIPAGSVAWQIQQADGAPPKPVVASGIEVVGVSGAGCFAAHIIQPNEAGHEYQTTFGNKGDNYQVDSYTAPTATKTSVPPTATSTSHPPTATPTSVAPTATFTSVPPTATFTSVPPTATSTGVPPTATFTSIPPTATSTGVPPTATFTSIPPTATFTSVPPTATSTGVPPTDTPTSVPPTNTPTDVPATVSPTPGNENPTATPIGVPTATPVEPTPTTPPGSTPPPHVLDPLSLGLAPDCNTAGELVWTVYNPNSVSYSFSSYTVDGVSHSGSSVAPGKHTLTTTATGTHTVVLFYGEGQSKSLTGTMDVCPLVIPVTGGNQLIPVTGADLSSNLSTGLFFGSLFLAGLGLLLSAMRKLLGL